MPNTVRANHKTQVEEDSRLGQTIDGYRVVRRIATGGMGTVYEAVHVHLGRRYAMKVLNPQLQGNSQATARFIAEGQAANQSAIHGVVAVHNVGRAENGSVYILMEYLEGETLTARISSAFDRKRRELSSALRSPDDRPLPAPARSYLSAALRLAKQLALILDAIHRSGVIHRDLKPDNIFVVRDPDSVGGERVKILDFGIAKVLSRSIGAQANSPVTWAPTLQKTLVGTVLGTPAYMAPEQWRGDGSADTRTDVYGLGAILFEMFAGRPPFTATLIGELMAQHCTEPPLPLEQVAPWTPAGIPELVRLMLAKSLRDRPQMPEVCQTLGAIVSDGNRSPLPLRERLTQALAPLGTRLNWGSVKELTSEQVWRHIPSWMRRLIGSVGAGGAGLLVLLLLFRNPPPVAESRPPSEPPPRSYSVQTKQGEAAVYRVDQEDDPESLSQLLVPVCRTPCRLPEQPTDMDSYLILVKPGYRSQRIAIEKLKALGRDGVVSLQKWPSGKKK